MVKRTQLISQNYTGYLLTFGDLYMEWILAFCVTYWTDKHEPHFSVKRGMTQHKRRAAPHLLMSRLGIEVETNKITPLWRIRYQTSSPSGLPHDISSPGFSTLANKLLREYF